MLAEDFYIRIGGGMLKTQVECDGISVGVLRCMHEAVVGAITNSSPQMASTLLGQLPTCAPDPSASIRDLEVQPRYSNSNSMLNLNSSVNKQEVWK